MKKLLALCGSLSLIATSSVVFTNSLINNQNKFNPTDNFKVPFEVQKHSSNLQDLIENEYLETNIFEIYKMLDMAIIMQDEIINEGFMNRMSTQISILANKNKTELEKLVLFENQGNAYNSIMSRSQFVSSSFWIKKTAGIDELFYEYQIRKNMESKLFFEIYDSLVTEINNETIKLQKTIADLNVRNSEIGVKLENLNKENEVLSKLIKVLDTNVELITKVKNIFDKGKNEIVSNYESAKWHADNWGLGFIPFYGTGFNRVFNNRMEATLNGMDTYIKTFNPDKESPEKYLFDQMAESLKSLENDLTNVDKDWNVVTGLMELAGLDRAVFELFGNLLNIAITLGLLAVPFVGPALALVWNLAGAGFKAKSLAETFKNELQPKYWQMEEVMEVNERLIYDTYNDILEIQSNMVNLYSSNSKETTLLTKELQQNMDKVIESNKYLEKYQNQKNYVDQKINLGISQGLYSDFNYYWYANKLGSIDPNVKKQRSINSLFTEIKKVNNEKNYYYTKLINELKKMENIQATQMIDIIIQKNEFSNEAFETLLQIEKNN